MIVCFGEALIDLFGHPRGSSVEAAEHFVPHTGGALVNVALTCGRLGVAARFVGAVGRDGHGDRVLRDLADAGVDASCVARVPERTGVTFVRVGTDGTRSFLFYRTQTADHAFSPAHLDAMKALDGASWLLTGTSALVAEPVGGALRRIVSDARDRGVPRAVDLNVRGHLWSDHEAMRAAVRWTVEGAAIVKASEEDLVALGLEPTFDALRSLAPAAVAVLTLAERGAVAHVGGAVLACPAVAVAPDDVVDATGAGDAFIAGLLAALVAKSAPWDRARRDVEAWRGAIEAGCALGAMAITRVGPTAALRAPWPAKVIAALAPRADRAQK